MEGVRFDAHHTFLHARAREDGSFTAAVDDRAEYISYVSAHATRPIGSSRAGLAKVGIEGVVRGPRWSLDAGLGDSVQLPAAATLNVRVAWSLPRTTQRTTAGEVYLRVNNILDQIDYAKVGLPESGRHLIGGIRLEF